MYDAFLLHLDKWVSSTLSPESTLNLRRPRKLPSLSVISALSSGGLNTYMYPSSLWPLKAIPCRPQNSRHVRMDLKMSLFCLKVNSRSVSYTHLTLPTICSV